MNISSYQSLSALPNSSPAEKIGVAQTKSAEIERSVTASTESFGGLIQQFLQQANGAQQAAETSITDFITGKTDNIHNIALSMANAEMSFKFFLEIRNKVVESFNDLMRMPF
jgi:flagellar hook-basal body complex protein FliE